MSETHPTDRFRLRAVAACCLTAAVHPGESEGGLVQTVAAHPARIQAASLLIVASTVLLVPALVGSLRLLRRRGAVVGLVGVTLTLTGAIAHAVFAGFQVVLSAALENGVDPAAMSAVVDQIPNVGFAIVMRAFLVGFFPGLLLLAIALWRSRAVARWAPIALVGMAVSDFLPVDAAWAALVGPLLGVAGFGAVGAALLEQRSAVRETTRATVAVSG